MAQRDDVPFDACLGVSGLCFGHGPVCHFKSAVVERGLVFLGYLALTFLMQAASQWSDSARKEAFWGLSGG